MLGLKNLSMNKLTTAYMVVSAAMIVFALALAPADSASVTAFVLWLAGALVLLGAWIAVGIEVFKRFFGDTSGRDEHTGRPNCTDEHSSSTPPNSPV
jgi:hypothetical protein